jgi:acyl carrier protein
LLSSSNEDLDFLTASSSNIRNHPKTNAGNNSSSTIDIEIRKLLHRVTDVPIEDFREDSTLEELGVDSLMITEVMSEVCKHFELEISRHQITTDLSSC